MLNVLRTMRDRLPFGGAVHRALREPYYRVLTAVSPRGVEVRTSDGQPLRVHARFLGMNPGCYEPEVTSLLLAHMRLGMTVVDVGAHVGLHTIMFARAVGGQGQVIAVEPSPANAGLLRSHLNWNGVTNVTVVEAAVSDKEGEANFAFCPDPTNPGGFANSLGYDIGDHKSTVRLATLDTICAGVEPGLIKMDVEGAELHALRGAEDLLSRCSPVLVVAIHPEAMGSMGDTPRELVAHMKARGYAGRDIAGREAIDPGFEEIIFRRGG